MDYAKISRHFQPIEMTNEQILEASSLMAGLKEEGVIPQNMNLGQFVTDCFLRGFYEYKQQMMHPD